MARHEPALPDETPADHAELAVHVIDERFYRAQLGADDVALADLPAHYGDHGARARLSPNPLFDPVFYAAARPDLAGVDDLLGHYLAHGAAERSKPHRELPAGTDILAVLRDRKVPDGRWPEFYLFDPAEPLAAFDLWIGARARTTMATPGLYAARAAHAHLNLDDTAWESLASAFDPSFYGVALARRGIEVPPAERLAHFLTEGAGDPHPFFRTAFYLSANPDIAVAGLNPFVHYVLRGWREGRRPHPVFRPEQVASGIAGRVPHPLAGYRLRSAAARSTASAVFAAAWYRTMHPEVDWRIEDPLLHYLTHGAGAGWSPNPAVDPAFVEAELMPMPLRGDITPLEYIEAHPLPRPRPCAMFDAPFYAQASAGLADACPATHYMTVGVWQDRAPNGFFSAAYAESRLRRPPASTTPLIGDYLAAGLHRRTRLLVIGHDGSRTGAPAILLRLTQHLASYDDVECIGILDTPGPLVPAQRAVCHLFMPQPNRLNVYLGACGTEPIFRQLGTLLGLLSDNQPVAVICNTSETRLYAEYFRAAGLPVTMLMHEFARFYGVDEMRRMASLVDLMVFPARFVADDMLRMVPDAVGRRAIIPQGLLKDGFGQIVPDDRRAVFAEQGITVDADDIIVAACGTPDGRKGIDHFVEVARRVRAAAPELPIRFVWIGGRTWRSDDGARVDSTSFWAHWDMLASDLDDAFEMIGEVPDTEPYLVNCDIFLLPSRADPFPCVVHEAMAARLPVIAFTGGGGAPEAFLPDAGIAVPYNDVGAMAEAVIALAVDGERRRRMGRIGRDHVLTAYRFDDYGERLVDEVVALAGIPRATLGERNRGG